MGAHLIVITSSLILQFLYQDITPKPEQSSAGIAYDPARKLWYDPVPGRFG
jgi:hypothetical protein